MLTKAIILFSLLISASSCFGPTNKKIKLSGRTMGTTYTITYFANKKTPAKEVVLKGINHTLKKINTQMSTYINDSEISIFNKAKKNTWIKISPWFMEVLEHALDLARKSHGSFDPTIGPLVNLWGFGPDNRKEKIPSTNLIKKTLQYVGHKYIKTDKNSLKILKLKDLTTLDLSASAKGYGVDKVSLFLEENNISDYLVEIGGEIKVNSKKFKKSWKLAIESPLENTTSKIHKIIELKKGALATSGNYRNFYKIGNKKYSHTIDYKTGSPVINAPLSVSIIDPDSCMNADALATLLMSLNLDKGISFIKKHNIKAYIISSEDGHTQKIDNYLTDQ